MYVTHITYPVMRVLCMCVHVVYRYMHPLYYPCIPVYTPCVYPYIQPIYPICMVRVYWVGNVEGGLVHVSLVLLCYLIGAVVSLVATVTIGK